jgi:hypothetical protein
MNLTQIYRRDEGEDGDAEIKVSVNGAQIPA